MNSVISRLSSGHQYCSLKSQYILFPSRCIVYGLLCASQSINCLNSRSSGTQYLPWKHKTLEALRLKSIVLHSLTCLKQIARDSSVDCSDQISSTKVGLTCNSASKPLSSVRLIFVNITLKSVMDFLLNVSTTTIALLRWYSPYR